MPGKSSQSLHDLLILSLSKDVLLTGRFIRFIVAVGGVTARVILSRRGLYGDFIYLERYLSGMQIGAIFADRIAWFTMNMREKDLQPLIEAGMKDPEVFLRMMELCPPDDPCNTQMLLSALYLHCVKPLEGFGSRLLMPVEEDARVEGNPEHIREMQDYLEQRLMNNIGGLFAEADMPGEEDVEKLKAFVRDSDPGEEFPFEVRAILSGRRRLGIFCPM